MQLMQRIKGAGALCLAAATLQAGALSAPMAAADVLVLKAGTVLPMGSAEAIEDGAVAIEDGVIVAIGPAADMDVPAGAEVIDYGSGATLAPGLVAADSAYTPSRASDRTADPTLLAIDNFDPYAPIPSALRAGITTAYLPPANGRLIAGQGAVVKTGGGDEGDPAARVLLETSGLHGSISAEARSTPGYWEPPVPATVDVGLGVPREQLPRTTMGAVLAIEELMAFARGDDSLAVEYGEQTGPALAKALEAQLVWRMGAESAAEVRAMLDLADRFGLPLVIDGATGAASLAAEIAASGAPVIARPYYRNAASIGDDETADWPEYDTIARLAGEGVRVAIASPSALGTSQLRFAAALAMRGGLSEAAALDAITIEAARVLGVDDRVGSLEVGKHGDVAVFSGAPMSTSAAIVATVIGGDVVWSADAARDRVRKPDPDGVRRGNPAARRRAPAPATVIVADEVHVGDGTVIAPGEVLLRGGKIAEVGRRVARPSGARVVYGAAVMPGMIDAFGYLGTEGSNRPFSTRVDTTRMLEPGDYADRKVAQAGVTTVNLGPRNFGGITPSTAYKPAAETFDGLVVDGVATVYLDWNSGITALAGANVKGTLARATEYVNEWKKYEAAMAKWTPPADDDEEAEDDEDDEEDDETEDDEDEDKKKKRKKGERDPAKPVTGVFEGTFSLANVEGGEPATARFRFDEDEDGSIEGSLRVSTFDTLLPLTGSRDDYDVTLEVSTPEGVWTIELAQQYSNDPEPKKSKKKDDDEDDDEGDSEGEEKADKVALALDDDDDDEDDDDEVRTFLRGEVEDSGGVIGVMDVTQTSDQYKVIRRPGFTPPVDEKRERPPKGKPKEPREDSDLEPFRRALRGEVAILVKVDRRDHVLDCVKAFEEFGVKPVLFDSNEAHLVARQISGRVAGVLMPRGKQSRLVDLSTAGVPIAFPSQAEEGAAELGVFAAIAVAQGLSPVAAMRGLTGDAAKMLRIDNRVGFLRRGLDADVLVLDGPPLEVSSSVVRAYVNGREID